MLIVTNAKIVIYNSRPRRRATVVTRWMGTFCARLATQNESRLSLPTESTPFFSDSKPLNLNLTLAWTLTDTLAADETRLISKKTLY